MRGFQGQRPWGRFYFQLHSRVGQDLVPFDCTIEALIFSQFEVATVMGHSHAWSDDPHHFPDQYRVFLCAESLVFLISSFFGQIQWKMSIFKFQLVWDHNDIYKNLLIAVTLLVFEYFRTDMCIVASGNLGGHLRILLSLNKILIFIDF